MSIAAEIMKRHVAVDGGMSRTNRTAFVLSGGCSLGAAQVGMLQALMESGIRPDLLVGTSVGAINAAWIAGQPDPDGALRLGEIWRSLRRQDIFPLSPWAGARGLLGRSNHLVPNTGLRSVLEKHVPYECLEDAEIPIHVMTTELKTGRPVVLSSGPAVPALLASSAIPGVFPPVTIGRRDLIDGGVANHAPVTTAVELGATRIYVLPIAYPWLREEPTSALGMALFALARFIEQKLEAEVAAHRDVAEIHVMPACDAPNVSPADFSHSDDLITRGYRSTRRFLGSPPDRPPLRQLRLARVSARAA
jgi:NTE family protein